MKSASTALEIFTFALIATPAKFRSVNDGHAKRHPSRWGLLCMLILAPGGFFASPGQSEARSVTVPLSQSDGFEIVRVSINGKGPYDFILDTGSSVTLVRRELLDQIGIAYREALPVNLATGTSYVEKAMVHTVAIAGWSATNIEVGTLDAAREGLLKTEVDGILGENFLKHFDILLDNEKHTLTLDRTAGLADQLAGEHLRLSHEGSFGSVTTPDRIIVNVKVPASARNPQRFLVDTGTNMAMLFPAKEAAWVYPQTSSQLVMRSYTGSLQCRQERASLRIGNGTLDHIVFASCKGVTRDKMDTDGLLPAGLFGRIFISHHGKYVIVNPQLVVTHACSASCLSSQTPAVQVQVYDYTGLNEEALHEFVARTQEILARSGVSIEVDACPRGVPAPCGSHMGSCRQVVIRMVAGVAKNTKNERWEPLGLSVAGHDGGIYASVFRQLAEDEAAEANIPRIILLVYAAVHEIGHLLLGDQAHTPQGLMKAQWEPGDLQAMAQNRFHFSPDQTRELTRRYGTAIQGESAAEGAAAVR